MPCLVCNVRAYIGFGIMYVGSSIEAIKSSRKAIPVSISILRFPVRILVPGMQSVIELDTLLALGGNSVKSALIEANCGLVLCSLICIPYFRGEL